MALICVLKIMRGNETVSEIETVIDGIEGDYLTIIHPIDAGVQAEPDVYRAVFSIIGEIPSATT